MDFTTILSIVAVTVTAGIGLWLWFALDAVEAQRKRASQWMAEAGSERTAKESYKYQLEVEKGKVEQEKTKVEKAKKEREKLFETCKQKDLNLNLANKSIEQLEKRIDNLKDSELNKQKEAILKQARHWKDRWARQKAINKGLNEHLDDSHTLVMALNEDAEGHYRQKYGHIRQAYDQLWELYDDQATGLSYLKVYVENLLRAIQRDQSPEELETHIQALLPFMNDEIVESPDQTIPELHEQENTVPIHQTDPPPEGEAESA